MRIRHTAHCVIVDRNDGIHRGIYLSSAFGEHFWSRLNPGGQDVATTFTNVAEARRFVSGNFENANDPGAYLYVPVTPSLGACATFDDLRRSGLGNLLPPPNPPPRPGEFRRRSPLDEVING
jgi:hypothetical protein